MSDQPLFDQSPITEPPRSNFFRLPNNWTDITAKITSLAELKVVEYVARHTWGFQEYGIVKKITLDEFQHGRKRSDGTRMDSGTGLSERGVINGLQRALFDNLLEVECDDRDKARPIRRYSLKMGTPLQDMQGGLHEMQPGLQTLQGALHEVQTYPARSLDRSEKETSERNLKKENKKDMSEPSGSDSARSEKSEVSSLANGKATKKQPSPFDIKARDKLYEVIATKIKINKRTDKAKDANIIRIMREHDQIPEDDIKATIKWYAKHIGEPFVPEVYSCQSFRDKWDKLQAAQQRTAVNGNGHAKLDKEGDEIVKRVLERRAQRIKT